MGKVVAPTHSIADISFIRNKTEFSDLLRKMTRVSPAALAALTAALESPNEKVRMRAAELMLQFTINLQQAQSNDKFKRLVAEVDKNKEPEQKKLKNAPPPNNMPSLNFAEITPMDNPDDSLEDMGE